MARSWRGRYRRVNHIYRDPVMRKWNKMLINEIIKWLNELGGRERNSNKNWNLKINTKANIKMKTSLKTNPRFKFFLDVNTVGCSKKIVHKYEWISNSVKGKIVAVEREIKEKCFTNKINYALSLHSLYPFRSKKKGPNKGNGWEI